MKTLEEKKLLVQMAQMLGEPVDPLLIESIEKEEQLSKIMFGETVEVIDEEVLNEEATLLTEADPPVSVDTASLLQKLAQLKTSSVEPPAPVTAPTTTVMTPEPPKVPPMIEKLQKDELQALKKTLTQVVNKINTLSWGGGGTGAVRINDQDDFDRTSYAEGRYLRWIDGMFRLDEVNPHDVIYNTTEVNVPYYVLDANDYYLGVTYTGPTIELPTTTSSGREIVIKDETGNCANNPIIVTGTVDNDAGGFILQVDNGAIHMLFRNGWRII